MKTIILLAILLAALFSLPVSANECDPVISVKEKDIMLSDILFQLSDKHAFKLTFPAFLDKKVTIKETMKLDSMLETLTKGMSTIVLKKQDDVCAGKRVSELIFLQTGEPSAHLNMAKEDGNTNALYIDDMELYVVEVLSGKRKAEKNLMTTSQHREYGQYYRKLKKTHSQKQK